MVKFVEGINIVFFKSNTPMRNIIEGFNCKYKELDSEENIFDKEFIKSLYNNDFIIFIHFKYINTIEEFYYHISEEFTNHYKPISSTIVAFIPYTEGVKFNNIYTTVRYTLSYVNPRNRIQRYRPRKPRHWFSLGSTDPKADRQSKRIAEKQRFPKQSVRKT